MTGPALQVTFLTTRIAVKPEGTGPKNVRLNLVTNPEVAISAAISPALHPWHPSVSSDLLAMSLFLKAWTLSGTQDERVSFSATASFLRTSNCLRLDWAPDSLVPISRMPPRGRGQLANLECNNLGVVRSIGNRNSIA